jgi:hypothetical protein
LIYTLGTDRSHYKQSVGGALDTTLPGSDEAILTVRQDTQGVVWGDGLEWGLGETGDKLGPGRRGHSLLPLVLGPPDHPSLYALKTVL